MTPAEPWSGQERRDGEERRSEWATVSAMGRLDEHTKKFESVAQKELKLLHNAIAAVRKEVAAFGLRMDGVQVMSGKNGAKLVLLDLELQRNTLTTQAAVQAANDAAAAVAVVSATVNDTSADVKQLVAFWRVTKTGARWTTRAMAWLIANAPKVAAAVTAIVALTAYATGGMAKLASMFTSLFKG